MYWFLYTTPVSGFWRCNWAPWKKSLFRALVLYFGREDPDSEESLAIRLILELIWTNRLRSISKGLNAFDFKKMLMSLHKFWIWDLHNPLFSCHLIWPLTFIRFDLWPLFGPTFDLYLVWLLSCIWSDLYLTFDFFPFKGVIKDERDLEMLGPQFKHEYTARQVNPYDEHAWDGK